MSHGHDGDHGEHDELTGAAYWDARYRESDRIWSGEPNAVLVKETDGLEPGRALDLGCGEGGDAIWLARRGWRVTATDISQVALDRAAAHAAEAGVAEDRIDWQRHDLGETFPDGTYDLVSAHFLHSYDDMPGERIMRSAAAAVAPGGVLLIVGHSGWPSWQENPHPGVHFPTPEEVLAGLRLADGDWEVLRCEEHERIQQTPDGQTGTRTDNTVKVRRLTP
ncbi:class I SAM-dependent methyltransferase [Streptomyces armeniacus]|uniref:Class I SAM-dependent methyltransferase n=1 Tax=Streptomyces armeniacus TaxID=83291 RepID=A0A345XRF8_9ACTN|nr:class I SAM-dependent methyltransferase [Streptomyces armeniacus]AXK34224.1 class I SAM-dependent methyltransferase [Streptomyces armeniacus]